MYVFKVRRTIEWNVKQSVYFCDFFVLFCACTFSCSYVIIIIIIIINNLLAQKHVHTIRR